MPDFETTIATELRSFLVKTALEGDDSELDEDTSLITSGIMNSRTVQKLMAFVKESYGIALSFKDLNVKNLETIRSIAKMVAASAPKKE